MIMHAPPAGAHPTDSTGHLANKNIHGFLPRLQDSSQNRRKTSARIAESRGYTYSRHRNGARGARHQKAGRLGSRNYFRKKRRVQRRWVDTDPRGIDNDPTVAWSGRALPGAGEDASTPSALKTPFRTRERPGVGSTEALRTGCFCKTMRWTREMDDTVSALRVNLKNYFCQPPRHPTEPSTLEAALSYARKGWQVLPLHSIRPDGGCTCGNPGCGSPGKHPRTQHGVKDATTDEKLIRTWWSRWPDANVGVATGPASGIWWSFDVDPRHDGRRIPGRA